MSNVITYQRFWQRRDTAANWSLVNPILAAGEIGVETGSLTRFKVGDGITAWNSLRYSPGTYGAIGCTFDGGGAVIAAGATCDVLVPFGCVLKKSTLLAEPSGSIEISVWSDTFGNYPPTVADNIAGSSPPSIVAGVKSEDAGLNGWAVAVSAGQTIRFTVASCTGIKRAVLTLEVLK